MISTKTTIATLIASAAILGGCASTSSDPYYGSTGSTYGGYNSTASMGYGTIDSIQVTRGGSSGASGAGAVVGGLVGAAVGSQVGSGSGRTAATVAGAVGGAALGHKVERDRAMDDRDMYQINIRMDNGEYRSVVQDSVYDLRVGNRVRIVDGRAYRY
ncbi:glycine zipper 2TM domain-containing protein [Massilia cavernae]|uniref:Glycine zipper 2TM domain-containing protein n=1 Tax=Massilia cavernae TaxID=2320864 RepID=A0A418Y4C4_9BURK|nr:glycine zipper 2TM domain-containing protein [Massilia cavernae]RJG20480.1 glycine zipper 2TM domain-containing protein [Massilia cavernae]